MTREEENGQEIYGLNEYIHKDTQQNMQLMRDRHVAPTETYIYKGNNTYTKRKVGSAHFVMSPASCKLTLVKLHGKSTDLVVPESTDPR